MRFGVQNRLGIIVLVAMVVGLSGCGSDDSGGSNGGVQVIASTSIIAQLAREVGGDHVTVETLIEPGVDPHTFEMTPGDVREIVDADLVLINGLELDDFIAEDVMDTDGDARIVVVSDGIELLESGGHGDEHDGDEHEGEDHEEEEHHEDEEASDDHDHEHGEFDPHVWQDPLRVQVMVANIAEALAEVDPDNADDFQENAAAYQERLDDTDAQIRELIDQIPAERRKLVTNHDAFSYFADRYGLEIVGTVIPGSSSEADPSAAGIAELAELIEHEGVTAIFTEELLDPQVAEALAEDTGVEIVHGLYSEQLGEEGSGADTIHGMLLANAEKISEALQ